MSVVKILGSVTAMLLPMGYLDGLSSSDDRGDLQGSLTLSQIVEDRPAWFPWGTDHQHPPSDKTPVPHLQHFDIRM